MTKNNQLVSYLDRAGISYVVTSEGLQVRGSLALRGTGITQLPEGLQVGGGLYLRGTGITELPEGLQVGGFLDLESTGITELPEGLQVGGFFDLEGSKIPYEASQPCGEYCRTVLVYQCGTNPENPIMVSAGCFHGTIDEFSDAVDGKYGSSEEGADYKRKVAEAAERYKARKGSACL